MSNSSKTGIIFDIQRFALHDGPGIRTLVFFKGCGLTCQWCSNPESINSFPELGLVVSCCDACGKCLSVCPTGALSFDENGNIQIDRARCTVCGNCVEICYPKALRLYGKAMTVGDVLVEVQTDMIFYQGSNGGVTLSGGEPLQQPSFAFALLEAFRMAGISTAIETAGYVPKRVFSKALPLLDYVLFDLKHLDSKIHQKFCGRPNRLILENAKIAGRSEVLVLFRMPLIPGINDDTDNLEKTAHFLQSMKEEAWRIELLPYHRFGTAKYRSLDRSFLLEKVASPTQNEIERARKTFEKLGIDCSVSR